LGLSVGRSLFELLTSVRPDVALPMLYNICACNVEGLCRVFTLHRPLERIIRTVGINRIVIYVSFATLSKARLIKAMILNLVAALDYLWRAQNRQNSRYIGWGPSPLPSADSSLNEELMKNV
jgi:hypothetical protein